MHACIGAFPYPGSGHRHPGILAGAGREAPIVTSLKKGPRPVRRLVPMLPLLLALLLAMPAAAQTPAASPGATPETLAGLEYVAARQYAPDPSQPIDRESEGVFILTVRIFQFDSEEHADAGWESTVESTAIETDVPMESDKVAYEEVEIADLGDRAWATTLAADTPEGDTGYFRLVYVQDGDRLYTLNAIAGSAEATLVTDDLAAFMVDAEPGEGEVRFSEDGTSTGGAWDLLPAADDEVLGGLQAFADAELDEGSGQ